ncbi:hypothetical protein [Sphingomonas aerolata]|uniref:hypothetical protein n=1 Tax=Sphingomonas aerolata TaxID=185951 RepID=UPI00334A9414
MSKAARLALIGKSGAGKSLAGRYLSVGLGVPHIKTGVICREISRMLFDNEDKRSTQRLDDALTALDPSIFLRAALRPIKIENGFVVDALRFREDLNLARDNGCKIVRILAPDEFRFTRLAERQQVFDRQTDNQHRSETELDDAEVDFDIVNDADLVAFEGKLAEIVARG